MDDPDPEAYGRATDAERFHVLHQIAEQIIQRLQSEYVVEIDHPAATHTGHDVLSVTRIRSTNPAAASVTLELTAFPGVLLRAGAHFTAAFPTCGCDACAEQPEQLADELLSTMDAIVHGRFEERQGPTGNGFTMWSADERRRGWSRREGIRLRTPRAQQWAAWTTRPPSSAG